MRRWPIPGTTKDQKGNRKDSWFASASGSSEAAEGSLLSKKQVGGTEVSMEDSSGRMRKNSRESPVEWGQGLGASRKEAAPPSTSREHGPLKGCTAAACLVRSGHMDRRHTSFGVLIGERNRYRESQEAALSTVQAIASLNPETG